MFAPRLYMYTQSQSSVSLSMYLLFFPPHLYLGTHVRLLLAVNILTTICKNKINKQINSSK